MMQVLYHMQLELGGILYYIDSCYVEPAYWNKGVFQKMFKTCIEFAKTDSNCVAIRMLCDMDNEGAQWLYKRLGMTIANVDFKEGYEFFI